MSNRVANLMDEWLSTDPDKRLACPLTKDELEHMTENGEDVAPGSSCDAVDIEGGSSWAQVATAVLEDWDHWSRFANAVDLED